MKNRFWKKAISILCASACLLSSAPVTALADGEFGGSLSVGGISTLLEEFFAKEDKKEDDVKEFVEKHGNAKDISCDNVAISKVEDYVNVRSGPSTEHEVIGKIFDQCAATILSTTTEEDGTGTTSSPETAMGISRRNSSQPARKRVNMRCRPATCI